MPGSGGWLGSSPPGAGPALGQCRPSLSHVPESCPLAPSRTTFPFQAFKTFCSAAASFSAGVSAYLPRVPAPLPKRTRFFVPSVVCCFQHITPFFVPSTLWFPSRLVKNTCLRCSVLFWSLPCPTYCLLCSTKIQRWEGLLCQFAACKKMLARKMYFLLFSWALDQILCKNSSTLLLVSSVLILEITVMLGDPTAPLKKAPQGKKKKPKPNKPPRYLAVVGQLVSCVCVLC